MLSITLERSLVALLFAIICTAAPGCEIGDEVADDGAGDDDIRYGAGSSYLAPGEALHEGEALSSNTGYLVYQGDGNLVFYRWAGGVIWHSRTHGTSPNVVVMQHDGNLVIYDATWRAVWNSGTWGKPGAYARLGDRLYIVPPSWACPPGWPCPPIAQFP